MSDADKPHDVNEPDDAEEPDDAHEPFSLTGDTRPFFPKSTLNAINSMFRTGGAFDAMLKPGGAFDAMLKPGGAFDAMLKRGGAFDAMLKPGGAFDAMLRDRVSSISRNLAAAAALNYPSYKTISVKSSTAYSPEMKGPGDYFQPWEGVIDSFAELQEAVARISRNHPNSTFLWRG